VSPVFAAARGVEVDLVMLVDPKPAGPILGYFRDQPIASAVIDYFGRRYVYAGVAPRRRNGGYDVDALEKGERLMEPGLVYRDEAIRPRARRRAISWLESTARMRRG
jgi:hypothetical protein